jgi:hypothetical protein
MGWLVFCPMCNNSITHQRFEIHADKISKNHKRETGHKAKKFLTTQPVFPKYLQQKIQVQGIVSRAELRRYLK